MVLHLHLCLWKHFVLLRELVQVPQSMSPGTMYGGYIHGLLHSPAVLAVTSLQSINTETLERLQGQAKKIGEDTTSRRPNDIVPTVMVRLQAELERQDSHKPGQVESEIGKIAKKLYPLRCTKVNRNFGDATDAEKANFLALMKAISPYLQQGPNVWWHKEPNEIVFHDGAWEPESYEAGPRLRHVRSCSVQQWQSECIDIWSLRASCRYFPRSLFAYALRVNHNGRC